MRAPRFLALTAGIAACLSLQACSDPDESKTADSSPPAAESPPSGLPAPPLPPPAAKLQGVDACSILNAEDVAEVIGHAMEGPNVGPSAGGGLGEGKMSSCSYESHSDAENAAPAELLAELNSSTWFVNVTVWVWPSGGQGARNYIQAMRDAPMTGDPVRTVDGLGDEAVWNGTLHARKGDVTVSLDVRPAKSADSPDEVTKERTLMEQVLRRL